ncbi:MAG: FCD domain-containing protein, partial [Alphaproteobacteria bacterium]|nr:FCD domain-containing protein [Alphaproteobacteria bacterium]
MSDDPKKTDVFKPLEKRPAYQIVSEAIHKAIKDQKLKEGDALPTENELCAQFNVNRSTIREGLRHVEQMGYLTRQGKKLIVTTPSYKEVGARLTDLLSLSAVSFRELWEVKAALEPMAAELSCIKATPELITALSENVAQMAAAIESRELEKVVTLDIEFHELIANGSQNNALILSRKANADLFYTTYKASMLNDNALSRLLAAHQEILKGIANNLPDHAHDWMYKHIKDFR